MAARGHEIGGAPARARAGLLLLAAAVLLQACNLTTATGTCDDDADCPAGYHCERRRQLCVVGAPDAALPDAARDSGPGELGTEAGGDAAAGDSGHHLDTGAVADAHAADATAREAGSDAGPTDAAAEAGAGDAQHEAGVHDAAQDAGGPDAADAGGSDASSCSPGGPAQIYRSVGPGNRAPLVAGNSALVISACFADFAQPLPDRVGVGDALQYASVAGGAVDTIAFVQARESATRLRVQRADGSLPTPVDTSSSWSLLRAYTSLREAVNGAENTGIAQAVRQFDPWSGGKDLVSASQVWNIACYGDAPDTSSVSLNGWTTDADHYLRIFTPSAPSEVGVSQRHAGRWDSNRYHLASGSSQTISTRVGHVRFEGLQCNYLGPSGTYYACINAGSGSEDVHISHSIFRTTQSFTSDGQHALDLWSGGTFRVWNNIIYGWHSSVQAECVWLNGGVGLFYNNTVYDCDVGFYANAGVALLKNNLVHSCDASFVGSYHAQSVANVGQGQSEATDLIYLPTLQDADEMFLDPLNGDLHLRPGAAVLDRGVDLLDDPDLAFGDDIDQEPRRPLWDVGADEL